MKKTLINIFSKTLSIFEKIGTYRAQEELRKHYFYLNTFKELNGLSDKELKDIGVVRGDIHSIALESYYDNKKV